MGHQEILSTSHKLGNLRNMLRYLLIGLLFGCQVFGLPADSKSSTTSTTTSSSISTTLQASCDSEAECKKCVTVPGCVFVKYKETSEICQLLSEVTSDPVEPKIFNSTETCPEAGDDTTTPIPTTSTSTTPPDTSTQSTDTTTTTNATTTTTTVTTTTTTTPQTTTTTTIITTTTTSTTPATTTTSIPLTTTAGPDSDTGKGHFDGWSFFGGILLTLGLAAIGLVGYKYYRLRSGSGGNY